ncbi:phage holin family protein [Kitasatospora sp. NPDC057198]|uniref:phage holin family protein n=1 Tax=Kitasatospora sp. NPDC057198 TaxID=3346046 RepID=UPI00363D7A1D
MPAPFTDHRAAGRPATDGPDRTPPPPEQPPGSAERGGHESLGDLISEITGDLSRLVRDEIELAKAEIKQEAAKAGKASGMLAGAGYAGHMAVVLGSLAVVFALAELMPPAWAALVVSALWALAGAALWSAGRRRLKDVRLKPEQTVQTLKEDAAWARHPMS